MSKSISVKNPIQKYVLTKLTHQKYLRFSELLPPKVLTNKLSYHLKVLEREGLIRKTDKEAYALGLRGLEFADGRLPQPKIVTMLVIQNSNGDILLWHRNKQPYIDTWTLPYGKLHIDDVSIETAAAREAQEKLGIEIVPEHAGDCYIRVVSSEGILSSTLAHIFRYETDTIAESDQAHWARPHKLAQYDLAPAVEEIVARTFFRDSHFFEEFTVNW